MAAKNGIKEKHMEKQYIVENKRELERLRKLVNELTDEELNLVIYKEGWTVAAALTHVAFWDERRVVLMRKWTQNKQIPLGTLDLEEYNTFNDSILPFLLEIPPRKAAELSVIAAETVDRELETASPALIQAIEVSGYAPGLDRSIHRKMHLDEIETFLQARHSKGS